MWVWIWFGIICLAAIIEFTTLQLIGLWFVLGGIGALIVAVCPVPFWIAIIVFFVISLSCLFLLRKRTISYLIEHNEKLAQRKKEEQQKKEKEKTNPKNLSKTEKKDDDEK